ncbi:NADPH-dependent 7-cyano-7-deazaguanine reductase [bacterium]|nr:NADPH-dependent 7-cyano-7-deazaguanine reductase [bacterium]
MTDYNAAQEAQIEVPEGVKLQTIPSAGKNPVIELSYPEFQSLCPVSNRHDQGKVTIRYKPSESILEQKSIRDYLASWRELHSWQEYITEEIATAIQAACKPEWLIVEITWAARGGIYVKTLAKRPE